MKLDAPLLALLLAAGASLRWGEVPTRLVVAAGDIASCPGGRQDATVAVVDALVPEATRLSTAVVAVLGDNAYEQGTKDDYLNCYGPSWGRHKARTRPALGNHDYNTPGAAGYFGYFGAAAAPPEGYYSFDLGEWHVVAVSSGDGISDAQLAWIRRDLRSDDHECELGLLAPPALLRAKLMSQYMFEILNDMIFLDSQTLATMDIDERKKYTDLVVKIYSELPDMVKTLESSYGVKTVEKKTKKKVLVGINDILR